MNIARRFVVKGHVQGVGYRFFAVSAAKQLGISGTVRNLPDGSVEVLAEGPLNQMEEFRGELENGPGTGHVAEVLESSRVVTGRFRGFTIEY